MRIQFLRRIHRTVALCLLVVSGCAAPQAPISVAPPGLSAEQGVVTSRLEEIGYGREEAIARTMEMSPQEVEFFSRHPEAIERTGFVIIGALLGSSVSSSTQADKNKKLEEENRRNEKALEALKNEIERDRLMRRIDDLERDMMDARRSGSGETDRALRDEREIRRLREDLERQERLAELEAQLEAEDEAEEKEQKEKRKRCRGKKNQIGKCR